MDDKSVQHEAAIRQWVTAVGFALEAENSAQRATAIDHATAMILADTATEAGLALISSYVAEPRTGQGFGTYMSRAVSRARIPAHVAAQINAVHRLRNGALHEATEVGADDVRRAIASARLVLDIYVPRVLRSAKALGPGTGVADAVAHVVAANAPIAWRLREGSAALRRRERRACLEHASAALFLARIYARPSLPRPPALSDGGRLHLDMNPTGQSWNRHVEGWLVPLALGVAPIAYARLSRDLPRAVFIPGSKVDGGLFDFRSGGEDERAAVSLETVSTVVLRLWQRDALATPTDRRDSDAEVLLE